MVLITISKDIELNSHKSYCLTYTMVGTFYPSEYFTELS
jgi:hypothetical protein